MFSSNSPRMLATTPTLLADGDIELLWLAEVPVAPTPQRRYFSGHGVSPMANFQQAISMAVCSSLVFSSLGLDGCKKGAKEEQAPAATYAVPTADQLYQMVAPIALFPDNLVALVLAGSTFPDQITAATQWVQQNTSLSGQALVQAVDQQAWDDSVKGLTQFPDVLQQMSS